MPRFYSPLRYPGGKSKLAPLLSLFISKANIKDCTYIEPFAGGAGAALALLMDGTATEVVINDYDTSIYSFWYAVQNEPFKLIELIRETSITIDEWRNQQKIYQNRGKIKQYSLELAFATLFLNRANRSGIITGGPIGGYEQNGKWKLDARFNKDVIIERIRDISSRKNSIKVYNEDIISLMDKYLPDYTNNNNTFIYFDPPYYNKGQKLYKNSFSHEDHVRISKRILERVNCPWVLTYDDVPAIKRLYETQDMRCFDLTYSAANKGKASEIIICSDSNLYPTAKEMADANICLNIRQQGENRDYQKY
jgi:DNA adenine methylase